ncbi:MAG: hypothetical protein ACLGJB_17860 [Blastocatellia bacterium]
MGVLKKKVETKDAEFFRASILQLAKSFERQESDRLEEFIKALGLVYDSLRSFSGDQQQIITLLTNLAAKEYPEPQEIKFPETQSVELSKPVEFKQPKWWKPSGFSLADLKTLLIPYLTNISQQLDKLAESKIEKVTLVDQEGRPINLSVLFQDAILALKQQPSERKPMFRGGAKPVKYSTVDGSLTGTVDGSNLSFTLPVTPNDNNHYSVYADGAHQTYTKDFTRSGSVITFVTGNAPSSVVTIEIFQ